MTLGALFIAIKGAKFDGHEFLQEAQTSGALGFIVESPAKVPESFKGPVFVVNSTQNILSPLAQVFFDQPSRELFNIGVTGTNGKTSVAYLTEFLLNHMSVPTGVLGTIDQHFQNHTWAAHNTTPAPIELHERLRELLQLKAKAVMMEVSSHSLEQNRVEGIHFNTVIFTNLTRDHLDYHKTMEAYFKAKEKLFTDCLWNSSRQECTAVVNIDDDYGARLAVADKAQIWTYGQRDQCDFRIQNIQQSLAKTSFEVQSPFGLIQIESPILGLHNVYNSVAALAAACSVGLHPQLVAPHLSQFPGVPGRLERVLNLKNKAVFVDYAHTPDALENVLKSLRQLQKQAQSNAKLWVVFGCGGDRDPGKRSLMGEIAARMADQVMVTSDNPRSEDPEKIIQDVLSLIKDKKNVAHRVDRAQAISQVLAESSADDIVLIAGKGHEKYQIIGSVQTEFDDVSVARIFLNS